MNGQPSTFYRLGRGVRWLVQRWALWLRIVLVIWIISLITPANARLPNERFGAVETKHPILCMHTRLDVEVTDLNVYRTLKMVRDVGAPTLVHLFYWAYLQPAENSFDWHSADRIVDMATQQGLTVIARLGIVPGWARPKPPEKALPLEYLAPEHYDDFARFVATFAARYRGRIKLIVPWNEPNLAFEWGGRKVSPAEYVDFLRRVYKAAHVANPDVLILGGALAPTLAPPNAADALSDILFLRGIYEAGGARYFDGLAVHTYGFTLPAEDAPAPDKLNFRRFELLLAVMREFGDGAKPVYITETGWNDHPRWSYAVRSGQRIAYTLAAMEAIEAQWPTLKSVCWWYFRSPVLLRDYRANYAFVTLDFRPLPIYDELRRWAR